MSGAMPAFGTKRTWACALHMSAFDPKRTWSNTDPVSGAVPGVGLSRYDACPEPRGGNETTRQSRRQSS